MYSVLDRALTTALSILLCSLVGMLLVGGFFGAIAAAIIGGLSGAVCMLAMQAFGLRLQERWPDVTNTK